jgi:hypothetical protein
MGRVAAAIIFGWFVFAPIGLVAQSESVRQARIGGIRLQYVDWGGRGKALVLVPNACDTAFVFGDIAPGSLGSSMCCR